MAPLQLPVSLARAAMKTIPPALLQRVIDAIMQGMRKNHPRFFQNLARLDDSIVCIKPSDLPYQFILSFGRSTPITLVITQSQNHTNHACVKGKLAALINLLEGRIDSDMLFFSRDIEITGDTSVVVALRNTIDREEINLLNDITSLFGPLAQPARRIIALSSKIVERTKDRLIELYEERQPITISTQTIKTECDGLRDEVKSLRIRLAKFEAYQKRLKATNL